MGGRRFQVERLHQVQRRLAQAQVMQLGPQVDDIAVLAARLVEAVEDVVIQVDAEGAAAGIAAVERAGTAALRAGPPQPGRQAQVLQYPGQRQLTLSGS